MTSIGRKIIRRVGRPEARKGIGFHGAFSLMNDQGFGNVACTLKHGKTAGKSLRKFSLRVRVVLSRIVQRFRAPRLSDRCKKLTTGQQSGRIHAMLVSLLSPTDAWITSPATAVSCSVLVSATRTT